MLISLIRLKTLLLAFAAMIPGNAIAAYHGSFRFDVCLLSILTAMSLQITTNLANSYGDGIRGTDSHLDKFARPVASGLVSYSTVKMYILISVILSCVLGLILLKVSLDDPMEIVIFIILGLISIVAAINYTVGEHAYGYNSLGEVSVFTFFGLTAVMGSYYLQTHELHWTPLLPAIASGFLTVGVLNVNNIRDIETDKNVDKITIPVRLGFKYSQWMHGAIIVSAVVCYILFAFFETWWSALWLLLLPFISMHGKSVIGATKPSKVGEQMAPSVLLAFSVNALFALGLGASIWMS